MKDFTKIASDMDEGLALGEIVSRLEQIDISPPKIISLIGGEAAGSTTLAAKLVDIMKLTESIGTDDSLIGDRLFRRANLEGKEPLLKYDAKFLERKVKKIRNLKAGEQVKMPVYDEASGLACSVGEENFTRKIGRVDYLIVEGAVHFLKTDDYLIYLDVPDDIRLENRIKRGISRRNEKSEAEIIRSFKLRQGAEYQAHIKPIIERADMFLRVKASRLGDGFIYQYSIYLKKKK